MISKRFARCFGFPDPSRDIDMRNEAKTSRPWCVSSNVAFLCGILCTLTCVVACADDDFPAELTSFVPDKRNPIFTAGGEGHWDVKIRERGWILREGEQWKMWYTGYDGTRAGKKMLGYATSTDGIAWTRSPKNPIYSEHWVEDMSFPTTTVLYVRRRKEDAQLPTSRDVEWKRTDTDIG